MKDELWLLTFLAWMCVCVVADDDRDNARARARAVWLRLCGVGSVCCVLCTDVLWCVVSHVTRSDAVSCAGLCCVVL